MHPAGGGMNRSVGIDDLAVYIPKLFLSTIGEFARDRGQDPEKLKRGIGIERIAIPDVHEDAATMAANAILSLIRRNALDPRAIGRIYIGTESGVDEAKAIGTYVIGMLEQVLGKGSLEECATIELKSACIGASFALQELRAWMLLEDSGTVGIAVGSDIAKYDLNTPGEYTQGAGSVALLVKSDPRLIALDGVVGHITRDEDDFFRPLGNKTAHVNGKHSTDCYMSAIAGAFSSFSRKALIGGPISAQEGQALVDRFDHLLFHIPFPGMVEYAAADLLMNEWRGTPCWREVTNEIGPEPDRRSFADDDEYAAAARDYSRRFRKSGLFLNAFRSKVEPSTLISRQVGNIYTGSLYLGLASLHDSGLLLPGESVAFGSYGSGCSAMFFSGTVSERARSIPSGRIMERIEARRSLLLSEYEELHKGIRKESIIQPAKEFALDRIDHLGYRHYSYHS
jgi:hydroxymethylglutaryl-CoA synthase